MSQNTFVPGIDNSSFDYDARFQRLMDALAKLTGEVAAIKQELARMQGLCTESPPRSIQVQVEHKEYLPVPRQMSSDEEFIEEYISSCQW